MRSVITLLVEDNPGDVRLVQESLMDAKVTTELHVVSDGEEALKFLNNEGEFNDVPLPDLILLDLNLPKKDGREVLEEIKRNPRTKRIPVVVLTSSSAEEDIVRTYDLQANCYITKPVDFNKFTEIIHCIENFWFAVVQLPPR